MDSEELWVPVIGFEGWYEVSSLGRVKRLPRLSKNSRNDTYKKYGEKILSLRLSNKKRYINAGLTVNGVTKSMDLQVLVLSSFIPKPFKRACVNHIDGNKHNNCLSNLEWVTYKENSKHAIDNKLVTYSFGSDVSQSKINEDQALSIKKMLKNKEKQSEIAKKLNISVKMVTDINTGRTWKHVKLEEK